MFADRATFWNAEKRVQNPWTVHWTEEAAAVRDSLTAAHRSKMNDALSSLCTAPYERRSCALGDERDRIVHLSEGTVALYTVSSSGQIIVTGLYLLDINGIT